MLQVQRVRWRLLQGCMSAGRAPELCLLKHLAVSLSPPPVQPPPCVPPHTVSYLQGSGHPHDPSIHRPVGAVSV